MTPRPYLTLALPVAALLTASPVGAQPADMEGRSAAIAQRYLQVWSASDGAAVGDVPYVYGPQVRFYGKAYTQADLTAEKRRAVRQWPVRSYVHRPGTMRITCNDGTRRCAVRSIMDYRVSNPQTGRSARGAATFDLGISFEGPRPVILYEGGGRKVRAAA